MAMARREGEHPVVLERRTLELPGQLQVRPEVVPRVRLLLGAKAATLERMDAGLERAVHLPLGFEGFYQAAIPLAGLHRRTRGGPPQRLDARSPSEAKMHAP